MSRPILKAISLTTETLGMEGGLSLILGLPFLVYFFAAMAFEPF